MLRRMSRYALVLSMLTGVVMLVTVAGCGGGEGVRTGSVAGWVYADGEGNVIISADRVPPEGYEPVENARVEIESDPSLYTTTDANGQYVITCIPPGTRTIVITVGDTSVRFTVVVTAGQVTIGGGHIEGGGGL